MFEVEPPIQARTSILSIGPDMNREDGLESLCKQAFACYFRKRERSEAIL